MNTNYHLEAVQQLLRHLKHDISFAIRASFSHINRPTTTLRAPINFVRCPSQNRHHHYCTESCIFSSGFGLAALLVITLTSFEYSTLDQLRTQRRNFLTSERSMRKLSSNSALCMEWKNTMKMSSLMSRVPLAMFTAVHLLNRREKRKVSIFETENTSGIFYLEKQNTPLAFSVSKIRNFCFEFMHIIIIIFHRVSLENIFVPVNHCMH